MDDCAPLIRESHSASASGSDALYRDDFLILLVHLVVGVPLPDLLLDNLLLLISVLPVVSILAHLVLWEYLRLFFRWVRQAF